jgi:RNA polymerase sigma-70 factor, ECF subfamily
LLNGIATGMTSDDLGGNASKRRTREMTTGLAQSGENTGASDDLSLVHATLRGGLSAFEELVSRYDRRLLRIALNVTHNREDAQDAVQEAFLKAFQHLDRFREGSLFSTWLIRITLNQAILKLRKQSKKREVSLDEDFQAQGDILPKEVTDWAPNPEQLYRASELRDILVKALQELRPNLRTVFVLRDIEGLSTDQITEVLRLSRSAVKARLFRARLELREYLNKHFRKPAGSTEVEPNLYQRTTQAHPSHRFLVNQPSPA